MKVVGLDLGSRTLGIAISDELGFLARAVETYRFNDDDYDSAVKYTIDFCNKERVKTVVLGYPKHMNGDAGIRAHISEEFKAKVEELSDIKVVLQDERLTTVIVDRAMISGNVVDEMACFNLNSLTKDVSLNGQTTEETLATDPRFKDEKTYSLLVFIELLKILGADDNTAQTIAHSAYDWIDGDLTTSSSNGAEDQYYMGNHMPHLANNGFFYDKSELRYIRGMNDVLYRRLEPMICALPNDDLNISMNTLKRKHAPLIQALFLSQITLEDAVKVIEERPQYGWDTSAGFFRTEGLRDSANQMNGLLNRIAQVVKFDSKYFVANIKVSFDDEAYAFTTRFERQTDTRIVVYQRLIGELHE